MIRTIYLSHTQPNAILIHLLMPWYCILVFYSFNKAKNLFDAVSTNLGLTFTALLPSYLLIQMCVCLLKDPGDAY